MSMDALEDEETRTIHAHTDASKSFIMNFGAQYENIQAILLGW